MKALRWILGILVLLAAGGLFFITYYPERAQNILIPDIEEVETADIRLAGDSLFATVGIRMKNKGIFRINIDSIDYDIRFDTIRVLNRAQDVAIALSPGKEDTFKLPVAVPFNSGLVLSMAACRSEASWTSSAAPLESIRSRRAMVSAGG